MADKLDDLFRQSRRSGAVTRTRQVSQGGTATPRPASSEVEAAGDRDRLVLIQARDGRMRYMLDGAEVRVGDTLEVFLTEQAGWVAGTFQWTGRERHPPSLKIRLGIPGSADGYCGDLDATLPQHARIRRTD